MLAFSDSRQRACSYMLLKLLALYPLLLQIYMYIAAFQGKVSGTDTAEGKPCKATSPQSWHLEHRSPGKGIPAAPMLMKAQSWEETTACVGQPCGEGTLLLSPGPTQKVPLEISGCQNRVLDLERARGAPATADCSRDHRSGKLLFEKVYFVNSFSSQN